MTTDTAAHPGGFVVSQADCPAVINPEDLEQAEQAYRTSEAETRRLLEARNKLVSQALRDGWTHAQIARATGLTRGRIGQLAQQITRAK